MKYIDADDARIDLDERGFDFFTSEQDIDEAQRWLDEQPAQDVAPAVRGHWLKDHNDLYSPFDTSMEEYVYFCNRCLNKSYRKTNYCANCGAKMDENENETAKTRGRWVYDADETRPVWFDCSVCGRMSITNYDVCRFRYCPCCGAEMDNSTVYPREKKQ